MSAHLCEKATVVYLRDKEGRVCLAQKKQDIHKANGEKLDESQEIWNGYGGKCEQGSGFLDTAVQELFEESGVRADASDLELIGRIGFFWPGNASKKPDMDVCFFFLDRYAGTPGETDEMKAPVFFHLEQDDIPFERMMKADRLFFPLFLEGKKMTANVRFRKGEAPLFELVNDAPTVI